MASTVATLDEVKGAQAFLRYIGVTYTDQYLILAVVAWFRQESGSIGKVIGNNPFNIRSSPLASGRRPQYGTVSVINPITGFKTGTKRAIVGYFATFSSLEKGFQAAAYLLLHGNKAYGYQLAVKALRNGGQQGARDFLVALALSSWDAAHYGTHGPSDAATTNNHLLVIYSKFTGLTLPAAAPQKPKPVVKAAAVKVPTVLLPPVLRRDYVSGYAVKTFYDERHRPAPIDHSTDIDYH